MKKRKHMISIASIVLAAYIFLAGCDGGTQSGDAPQTPGAGTTAVDSANAELTAAFRGAMEAQTLIRTGSAEFGTDGSANSDGSVQLTGSVHPVTDARFPNLQTMREYLAVHFTGEYAADILTRSPYKEIDGRLMVNGEGSGDTRSWNEATLKSYSEADGTAVFAVPIPGGTEEFRAVFTQTDAGRRIRTVEDMNGSVL